MKTLMTALTLGTLITASALVHSASAAPPMDAAREQALQECSTMSQKYSQTAWGVTQLHQFRACMSQHGQQE